MAMELLIELHFTLLLFNVWVNSSPYSMAGIATKFTIIYKFLDFSFLMIPSGLPPVTMR